MYKFFAGNDITSFEDNGKQRPISRVTLKVDDTKVLTAGDDTGIELLADCPHATQSMVNAILSKVKGYRYQMFSAGDAGLDPAAELGDGITAGGVYSVISRLSEDGSGYPGVTAPGETELEDEYPAAGPMSQAFDRTIAETRSSITKTAEEIRLEVANEVQGLNARITIEVNRITQEVSDTAAGLSSKIEQTASSLTSSISSVDGRVSTLSQTVDGISTRVQNAEGGISSLEQTASSLKSSIRDTNNNVSSLEQYVDSMTLSVSNGSDSSTIRLMAGQTVLASREIYFSGMVTFTDLSTSGRTTINGGNIDTDTLRVNNLFGRYINLNTDSGNTAGTIEVTGASTASYAVELHSNGALRLTNGRGNIFLETAQGTYIQMVGPDIVFGDPFDPVMVVPNGNGIGYLGSSSRRWNTVYASTGTIQTSDREAKHEIAYDLSRYGGLFDRLRPISYKLNQNESNRTHLGLCAQDVEQALSESGLSSLDFAGFIKSPREDETGAKIEGEYDYALRYTEFIALLIAQMQALKARVAKLEGSETP